MENHEDRARALRHGYSYASYGDKKNMKTEILYEDSSILVVYKPAGFAVQTARVGQPDVVSELKNYLRLPQAYLGVIHRLDQPVEGLLVFAKDKKSAAALSARLQRQGEEGILSKRYYAVLCGSVKADEAELVDYLGKNRENRAVVVDSPAERQGMSVPRKAVLQYRILQVEAVGGRKAREQSEQEVLGRDSLDGHKMREQLEQEAFDENPYAGESRRLALADIRIETGRFHQIRAQMAHAGMPILGDAKYGDQDAAETARILGVRETALCAYSLEFAHPASGKEMKFQIAPRGKAFSFFGGYKFQEKISY